MVEQATEGGRLRLGQELRAARLTAGMTQAAAGMVLDCGQAKIHKIERTLVAVSMADLNLLLDAYQVDEATAEELRRLAAEDDYRPRPRSEPRSLSFRKLTAREPDASEILCLHSEGIPGTLQSEKYMLHQFNIDPELRRDVTELIRLRTARTRIFTDDGPHYRAILSESALYRTHGGSAELVLDQVDHLLHAIRTYPRLTLQILRYDAPIPWVGSDFVVARFANSDEDFVYLEDPGEGRIVEKIAPFVKHWRQLSRAALGPDETIKFLTRLAAETEANWHAQITTDDRPYARGD